jgi:hypothetical protein
MRTYLLDIRTLTRPFGAMCVWNAEKIALLISKERRLLRLGDAVHADVEQRRFSIDVRRHA